VSSERGFDFFQNLDCLFFFFSFPPFLLLVLSPFFRVACPSFSRTS
jgi:hypothetical protein